MLTTHTPFSTKPHSLLFSAATRFCASFSSAVFLEPMASSCCSIQNAMQSKVSGKSTTYIIIHYTTSSSAMVDRSPALGILVHLRFWKMQCNILTPVCHEICLKYFQPILFTYLLLYGHIDIFSRQLSPGLVSNFAALILSCIVLFNNVLSVHFITHRDVKRSGFKIWLRIWFAHIRYSNHGL